MKNKDLADMLRRFVRGDVDPYEFDDFTSVKQRDERLEAIRQELLYLPDAFPPEKDGNYCSQEGVDRILKLANEVEVG